MSNSFSKNSNALLNYLKAKKEIDKYITVEEYYKELSTTVDGQANSFYQSTAPHSEHLDIPVNIEYEKLLGDLWFEESSETSKSYKYIKELIADSTNVNYKWVQVSGLDALANKVGKTGRIFTTTPAPPYSVNDLWIQGENGDVLVSEQSQDEGTGSFTASDWVKASKYTDDKTINDFIRDSYDPFTDNIQGQVDQKSDSYRQETEPFAGKVGVAVDSRLEIRIGDIWSKTNTNETFVFSKNANESNGSLFDYTWEESSVPDQLLDKVDGKAQIFFNAPDTLPTPPYYPNDLWLQGEAGANKICTTGKNDGETALDGDWQVIKNL
jgi:hypothetical protein